MGRITCILITLGLSLGAQTLSAQSADVELKRFRVLQVNGDRFEGINGTLTSEGLNGNVSGDSTIFVPIGEIRDLDRWKGSKASSGALIGACVGAATVGLAIIRVSADPNLELREENVVPVLLGFSAVGGLIGLAIGASMQSWEDVPLQTAFQYDPEGREAKLVLSFSF